MTISKNPKVQSVSREIGGRTLTLETGWIAKQASAAVIVSYGETVVTWGSLVRTHEVI